MRIFSAFAHTAAARCLVCGFDLLSVCWLHTGICQINTRKGLPKRKQQIRLGGTFSAPKIPRAAVQAKARTALHAALVWAQKRIPPRSIHPLPAVLLSPLARLAPQAESGREGGKMKDREIMYAAVVEGMSAKNDMLWASKSNRLMGRVRWRERDSKGRGSGTGGRDCEIEGS